MNLKENQVLAAQMTAVGRSGRQIAEELNVAEETVSRWKSKEEFVCEVQGLQKQAMEVVETNIRGMAVRSVEVLKEILDDNDACPRLRAMIALKLLDFTAGWSDPSVLDGFFKNKL